MEETSALVKLIADNGITVVMSAIMIIIFLNVFKKTTKNWERMEKKNDRLTDIILSKGTAGDYMEKQTEINNNMLSILKEIREGATKECTIEQVKVTTNALFDLAKYTMLDEVLRIKRENHLVNESAVQAKVKTIVYQRINDRKSKLYNFNWKGKPLSEFDAISKAEIADILLGELYATDGFSEDRVKRNIELFYDNMKLDLFNEIVAYNNL
jgi:hypothetical protein|nr:MAG TPA: hypothetical protein [Herelleviridae sp.]